MLKVTNDGRKLALDQRLIDPNLPENPNDKVHACAENVYRIWSETKDKKLTQLVFCDLSTPKPDGFNVYDDLRNLLISMGIPENEVQFIHSANTEVKKAELFAKVRSGDVRVLMGSTGKMGAGTNVQRLLVATHHLDCGWKPSDIEQRNGRMIRQGNTNAEVYEYRYVTEASFDSYMWQLLETKQKFIGQIMTSKSPARSADDLDDAALSYAEVKALAAGNPMIKEKMDLDIQVSRLKTLKTAYNNEHYRLEDAITQGFPAEMRKTAQQLENAKADTALLQQNTKRDADDKDVFAISLMDTVYTKREDAGKALLGLLGMAMNRTEPVSIGRYKGFDLQMRELQDDFEPPVDPNGPPSKAMLFADYLVQWLEIAKSTVKLTTYASYKELSNSRIIPYFRNLGVTLGDLKAVHIQAFYQEQLERVKPNTVIHYHAVIHRALKYAVKTDLIDVNPADKVDRPKKNEFTGNFYSKDEMNALFDAVRGSKIEVAVMLTAFYGLRRSEVVGLKWAAVDFEQNTIEICHTVTTVRLDGKEVLVESNGTKTKSSKRTLPLVPVFRERLLALQEEQKENRKLCGRCYNKKYADYICVDAMGNLLKPDYLSNSFQIILQNYHLRRIRFHDLRHSCASLLLANGVPMKMIQEWLGHSDFSTTANIYSHLDYASKVSSAEAMLNGLGMGSNPGNDT